jgi:hypothetical protein
MAEPSFVPIVPEMSDAAPASAEIRDSAPRMPRAVTGAVGSSIEIKLAGAVVRVTRGTDTALLAEVLRAIRASAA